jgi:hypothetical protein
MPDDPSRPRAVTNLRGTVTRGPYAVGSKSERTATFIETNGGRYLLRRKEGPSFADSLLDRYVGRAVQCDGFIVGTTLLVEKIGPVG